MDLDDDYYARLVGAYLLGGAPAAGGWAPPRGLGGCGVDALDRATRDVLIRDAREAGVRIHRFKRTQGLARVSRVLGALRSLAPSSLVDLGSGRGTFLWPLIEALPDLPVLAIDRRPEAVACIGAVGRGGVTQLRAGVMDATQLALCDDAADVVTMLEVLEHIPDAPGAMAEAIRVARRFVVVTVPSKPDENPEHVHLFSRTDVEQLAADAGAARTSIDGVHNHLVAVIRKA